MNHLQIALGALLSTVALTAHADAETSASGGWILNALPAWAWSSDMEGGGFESFSNQDSAADISTSEGTTVGSHSLALGISRDDGSSGVDTMPFVFSFSSAQSIPVSDIGAPPNLPVEDTVGPSLKYLFNASSSARAWSYYINTTGSAADYVFALNYLSYDTNSINAGGSAHLNVFDSTWTPDWDIELSGTPEVQLGGTGLIAPTNTSQIFQMASTGPIRLAAGQGFYLVVSTDSSVTMDEYYDPQLGHFVITPDAYFDGRAYASVLSVSLVPEPSSPLMMLVGLMGVLGMARLRTGR